MNRTPRTVDWQAVLDTPLTATLARRGNSNMPDALASKRILSALHEGAHLLAAAKYRALVIGVDIPGMNGRAHQMFDGESNDGSCRAQADDDIDDAAISFAGYVFEQMMFGEKKLPAATNDRAAGLRTLCNHAIGAYDSPLKRAVRVDGVAAVLATERQLSTELEDLLHYEWPVLDSAASALLMFSDAKGRVNGDKARAIKRELHASLAVGLPSGNRNRSHSPNDLHNRLGDEITKHWPALSVQDDLEKWNKIEAEIYARHNIENLAAQVDAFRIKQEVRE